MTRTITLTLLLVSSAVYSSAQVFEISGDPIFKSQTGKVFSLALAGGLNQPQFSNFDFNRDGVQDLFVFERDGSQRFAFINETKNGVIKFRYEPSIDEYFPKNATEFMLLRDYNGDGEVDIFLQTPDSSILFKNITVSTPQFEFIKLIKSNNLLQSTNHNRLQNLIHVSGCLPDIIDLDGDGDLDYVTLLGSTESELVLNRNTSAEQGNILDSIEYERVSMCFAGMAESNGSVVINSPCGLGGEKYKKKHSATKSIMFFDNDADGDIDMFYGNSEKEDVPVVYLENGKADLNYYKDTFISINENYFGLAVESNIPTAPGMYNVDVDNDGVKDLILATNEGVKSAYSIKERNNVLLFLNKNATDNPDFKYETNSFLLDDMMDFGGNTSPALIDIDGDGDQDLFLVTTGDHYVTGDTTDFIVFFENVGTSNDPQFQIVDEDYLEIKSLHLSGLKPAFADLDGDLDFDLYLGSASGNIIEYENVGSSLVPNFSLNSLSFVAIDTGDYLAPLFYDLNKDGLQDMLLGSQTGNIKYYQNVGSAAVPQFILVNDTLGDIKVNKCLLKRNPDDLLGPKILECDHIAYSNLQVVTWPDTSSYLAVGAEEGRIRLFNIPGNLSDTFPEITNYMVETYSRERYTKDWGRRIFPASADLNGDGVSDLLIGNSRGSLHYLQGKNNPKNVAVPNLVLESNFMVYPNPTRSIINVRTSLFGEIEYRLTDAKGVLIQNGALPAIRTIQPVQDLNNGIYFLTLYNESITLSPRKVVVAK